MRSQPLRTLGLRVGERPGSLQRQVRPPPLPELGRRPAGPSCSVHPPTECGSHRERGEAERDQQEEPVAADDGKPDHAERPEGAQQRLAQPTLVDDRPAAAQRRPRVPRRRPGGRGRARTAPRRTRLRPSHGCTIAAGSDRSERLSAELWITQPVRPYPRALLVSSCSSDCRRASACSACASSARSRSGFTAPGSMVCRWTVKPCCRLPPPRWRRRARPTPQRRSSNVPR